MTPNQALNLPSGDASGDEEDERYLMDDLNQADKRKPAAELRDLDRRIERQHKIDDARIALVYEALSKGVELENNQLYQDMLEEYPYFQKIRSERKQAIKQMERLAKM